MGAQGTVELDFGAFPGQSDASLDIAAAGVVAASVVEAWILPKDTADHLKDEHLIESLKVIGAYKADGTITVYGFNTSQVHEPVQPDPFNGAMIQAAAAGVVWRPATSPGGTIRGGGIGTRIYGKWTVAWVWN